MTVGFDVAKTIGWPFSRDAPRTRQVARPGRAARALGAPPSRAAWRWVQERPNRDAANDRFQVLILRLRSAAQGRELQSATSSADVERRQRTGASAMSAVPLKPAIELSRGASVWMAATCPRPWFRARPSLTGSAGQSIKGSPHDHRRTAPQLASRRSPEPCIAARQFLRVELSREMRLGSRCKRRRSTGLRS
jgi:hypothetical protein